MLLSKSRPAFNLAETAARAREFIRRQQEEYRNQPPSKVQFSLTDPKDELRRQMEQAGSLEAAADLYLKYQAWEKENAVRSSFSNHVQKWLQVKKIKPSAFYKSAGIEKQVFSKLKNDYLYQPSRETALRCCFGLCLSYKEAAGLLKLAGFSLSPGNSRDLALRFCLENGIHDLSNVNALLRELGETPLTE